MHVLSRSMGLLAVEISLRNIFNFPEWIPAINIQQIVQIVFTHHYVTFFVIMMSATYVSSEIFNMTFVANV